ncbi:MAG TPA: rod shape-determining protein [Actinomycetota bacterium]|jgi:rod shape-determining protein MreB|nr:rod shape-determining protein [Actinomycetota bacterium]
MGRDLAIDLGTANTLVYRQGEGVVFDEPAVVAVRADSGDVLAMGEEAWQLLGGESGNVLAVRPLRKGTMTEFDTTRAMIEVVIRRTITVRFPRPRVLVAVPSMSSEVERRAIEDAVRAAGVRQVTLVEEPLAAAIGAGLPVHEPVGNLVADIGGGRSEMAVVSMGGVVSGRSAALGGFDLDTAVQHHIRDEYGVAIGEKAAEEIKIAIGSAFPTHGGKAAVVIGRELDTGNTVEVKVTEDEIRKAIGEPVRGIVEAARLTLAEAPPELTHDVLETGMFLTGGGALLRGFDMLLAQECEVPVHVVERPLETVAVGTGRMLEHLEDYRSAFQLVRRR